jgi:hypothetical protein
MRGGRYRYHRRVAPKTEKGERDERGRHDK